MGEPQHHGQVQLIVEVDHVRVGQADAEHLACVLDGLRHQRVVVVGRRNVEVVDDVIPLCFRVLDDAHRVVDAAGNKADGLGFAHELADRRRPLAALGGALAKQVVDDR